jgi:endonuclease YncB( thermonuclease family)
MKLFLLFLILPSFAFADDFANIKIARTYDGDTFYADLPCPQEVFCKNIPVRVSGIDTPELKTKDKCEKAAAQKAKAFTEDFLKAGAVELRDCKRDKYFRLLCEVWAGDKNLATELLGANLAIPYEGGTKEKIDWCRIK